MTESEQRGRRVAGLNVAASLGLALALGVGYALVPSNLLLAQVADSSLDVLTTLALLWALRFAHHPPDADHPIGHQRVEPLAALIAAAVAGVAAAEVGRHAVTTLLAAQHPDLPPWMLAAFGAKAVVKAAVALLARRASEEHKSPTLDALAMDAVNDVVVNLLSLLGFAVAAFGLPSVDAWLALPAALWIAWSALLLGRENIRYLMGAAPSDERLDELAAVAMSVAGVRAVGTVLARHHGQHLDVTVDIEVDANLTVAAAHDIGVAVEQRLLEEPDVAHAGAHIDPTSDAAPRASAD